MIILDNGHGFNTPGKRSPIWADGSQLKEWEFNRDIVKRISIYLDNNQIGYRILVPENIDIKLSERVRRANMCTANDFLISIHANAGGGTGWEAHTSPGTTKADMLSAIFYHQATQYFKDWKIRKGSNSPADPDWDSSFTILTQTKCAAVLTENFFMDTERDCRFIMSQHGRQAIADMHISAIKIILNNK